MVLYKAGTRKSCERSWDVGINEKDGEFTVEVSIL